MMWDILGTIFVILTIVLEAFVFWDTITDAANKAKSKQNYRFNRMVRFVSIGLGIVAIGVSFYLFPFPTLLFIAVAIPVYLLLFGNLSSSDN